MMVVSPIVLYPHHSSYAQHTSWFWNPFLWMGIFYVGYLTVMCWVGRKRNK